MFRFFKYLLLAAAAGYALLAVGFEQKAALLVAGALFAFGLFRVAGFLVDLLLFLIVLGVLGYRFHPAADAGGHPGRDRALHRGVAAHSRPRRPGTGRRARSGNARRHDALTRQTSMSLRFRR